MKIVTFFTLLFLLNVAFTLGAQTRSTKEAKILLIVDGKNPIVTGLELFAKADIQNIRKRYPGSSFYIGLLRGSYELEGRQVVPYAGAVVTIFTERQYLPNEEFFPAEDFVPGDWMDLGEARAKIISKNKGELTLKTQQKN